MSDTRRRIGRRKLLAGVGAASAAAAASVPNVAGAQTTTFKMQGAWDSDSLHTELARQYIERVEAMAGGSLRIEYLERGAVVDPHQIAPAVHELALDAGHSTTANWVDRDRAALLFGSGPVFGCNSQQIMGWIHEGGGRALYEALLERSGLDVVGFLCVPMPSEPLGWFKQSLHTNPDLSRRRFGVDGPSVTLFEQLGMEVVELSPGDRGPAFEAGQIDAFAATEPSSDRQLGGASAAGNYYLGGFHQTQGFVEITFNKRLFRRLPKDHRAILEYAADAVSASSHSYLLDRHSDHLLRMMADSGVNVARTPEGVLKQQLEAWDRVLEEFVTEDPLAAQIVDSQKRWCERVGYFTQLNTPDFELAFEHYFPGRLSD